MSETPLTRRSEQRLLDLPTASLLSLRGSESFATLKLRRLLIGVQSGLWFVPVLCVVLGAVVSFATLAVDRAFNYEAIPSSLVGGPDAATAILSTIALSMVSLTALVLTITMVVVQLAMGQFSPRIVQRILQDKPSQLAIGLFVATFVHAILTLREVTNNGDGTGQVPGVGVVTAFVLVVASIAVLVMYVQHIGQSLRVSALIELVGKDTRRLIDRYYPSMTGPGESSATETAIVSARESGVITVIGHEALVDEARRVGCTLELIPALGEFVPAGSDLFRVHGAAQDLDQNRLHQSLILRLERTLDEDVPYGLRLLVDIAQRSLSESPLQDPTTAVQAIDRLHDILRHLVQRPFPDGRYRDETGVVRLIVPIMSWDAYLTLAFEEIRLAGSSSPQIARRMKAALLDLRSVAPPERLASIEHQLQLLETATRSEVADQDLDVMLRDDGAGIGVDAGSRRAVQDGVGDSPG